MKYQNLKTLYMLAAILGQVGQVLAEGCTPQTQRQLAASSSGRIALHLLCAFRDHKFQWHWQGLAREFFRA